MKRHHSIFNRYLWIALFLLAMGAALRFGALERHSFWTDEFFTLRSIGALVAPQSPAEATPPLYFLLLKFWSAAAGATFGSLRAFSALWGVAGLGVVWLAASRLIAPRAGLFALALTAFSPFHLAYSQEARPYAMVFALSAASLWTLAEAIQGAPRWWVPYLAVTSALLYTHYWGLFVWAAGALYALGNAPRQSPDPQSAIRNLLPVALAGVTFLPHLATLAATTARHAQPDFWTPPPALANLGQALVAFTGTRFYVGGWLFSLGPAVFLAVGIFSALWTTALVAPDTWRLTPAPVRWWLVCYLGGALLLPFLVSYALPQMFVAWRYTMAAFPAALWLAARGWNLWPAAARAVSAGVLIMVLAAGDLHYFTGYQKGNIKQAAELVAGLPAGDTVLIIPAYLQPHWNLYYHGPLPTIPEAGIDEIAPSLARYKRAVFVTLDVPNAVKDAMDARYLPIAERRYPAAFHLGLLVAVYRLG